MAEQAPYTMNLARRLFITSNQCGSKMGDIYPMRDFQKRACQSKTGKNVN